MQSGSDRALTIEVKLATKNTREIVRGETSPGSKNALRYRRSGLIALGLLLLVPLLAIGIPSLLGYHVMMVWDNQVQNLPLRVLAGRDIAAGHLPLWNPFVWSGTPLLGGFNAGAFYPAILLFAALPSFTAWALTWILTYWISIVGIYLLCRKLSISTLPATIAAATYSFTGIMLQMVVHIMVIEADAWLPWLLLGIEGIMYDIRGSSYLSALPDYRYQHDTTMDGSTDNQTSAKITALPWMRIVGWMILVAFSLAMVVLSGSTSSMAAAVILAGFVIIWHTVQRTPYNGIHRRMTFLAASLAACIWGIAFSSTQLLVGMSFIGLSQRHNGSTQYLFGEFPLSPARWLQAFLPGIAGGSGNFGLPASVLSIDHNPYMGLLPLVAFISLFATSIGRHRDPEAGKWMMWIVLGIIGIILAAGSDFPGGIILSHIPFYGSLRVQGRMAIMTDLSFSVIIGFWLQKITIAKKDTSTWIRTRKELTSAIVPMIIAVVLAIVGLTYPRLIETILRVAKNSMGTGRAMWPSTVATLILAIAGLLFVIRLNKMQLKSIRLFVAVFTVVDIGFFGVTMAPGFQFFGLNSIAPTTSNFSTTITDKIAPGQVQPGTRYGIWDPNISSLKDVFHLAQPDQNVLANISSIQGVGSAVWGTYDSVTCTHPFDSLRTPFLSSSISNELDIGTLLVAKNAFTTSSSKFSPASSECLNGGYGSEIGNSASEAASVGSSSKSSLSSLSSATVDQGNSSATVTTTQLSNASTAQSVNTQSSNLSKTVSHPTPMTTNTSHTGGGGVEWYVGSIKDISRVVIDVPNPIERLLEKSIRSPRHTANYKRTSASNRISKKRTMPPVAPEIQIELLQSSLKGESTSTQPLTSTTSGSTSSLNTRYTDPVSGSITSRSPGSSLIVAKSLKARRIGQNKKYTVYSATLNLPVQTIAIRLVGALESHIQPQHIHITTIGQSGSHNILTLNGPLVNAVRPGKWRYTGRIGDFISYYNTDSYGHLWFAKPGTTVNPGSSPPAPLPQPAGDSISVKRFNSAGNETDSVDTIAPVLLVRSMAWAPGWSATIKESNGRTVKENVSQYGLVQAVLLPRGASTVTFSYWPPGMTTGIIFTYIALFAFMVFIVACIVDRIRVSRHRQVAAGTG